MKRRTGLTRSHSDESKGEKDGEEELEEADPANILLQDLVQRLALLLSLKGMEDGEKTTLSKKNS